MQRTRARACARISLPPPILQNSVQHRSPVVDDYTTALTLVQLTRQPAPTTSTRCRYPPMKQMIDRAVSRRKKNGDPQGGMREVWNDASRSMVVGLAVKTAVAGGVTGTRAKKTPSEGVLALPRGGPGRLERAPRGWKSCDLRRRLRQGTRGWRLWTGRTSVRASA